MRQVPVRSSFLHRLCQSALFLLTLLPLLIHSQGEQVIKSGETCSQHARRIAAQDNDRTKYPEWHDLCSQEVLANKSTITMRDLIECYTPDCNVNSYIATQCHKIAKGRSVVNWCWCSGPTGLSIPHTLTNDMQPNQCITRQSCSFHGTNYSDGEVFQPIANSECGICECLDGEVTCFDDFVPDLEGKLNASQLNQLSDLLKLFFYFEEEHRHSILYDIRAISRQINTTISNETQMQVLYKWFQDFDTDGNGCIELNHTEERSFHNYVHQLTSCHHFLDHVSNIFDIDNSGSITLEEWLNFFVRYTTTVEPVDETASEPPVIDRRSAARRAVSRRKNRRKFYYTLSSN